MTERILLERRADRTAIVWFVPLNLSNGPDYAEGDMSFIKFLTEQEAQAFIDGYHLGKEKAE